LAAGYFAIYWSDTISDPSKPGDPYSFIGRDTYSTFSNSMSKELNVYLKHQFLESDVGLVGETIEEYHSL
jgi:hypothetical protein